MVSKNKREGQLKRIERGNGSNATKKNQVRKDKGCQVPQLELTLALSPAVDYVSRVDVYVRYVEMREEDLELMDMDEREVLYNGKRRSCLVLGCGETGKGPSFKHMCIRHCTQLTNIKNGKKLVKLELCDKSDADSFSLPGLEMTRFERVAERLEATGMVHLNGCEKNKHPKVATLINRMKFDFNFAMVQGSLRGYSDDMKFIFVHPLFTTDKSIANIANNNPANTKWLRKSN